MGKINLLPSKFAPKPSIIKLAKTLKMVNIVGTVVVVILVLSLSFMLVYNNQNIAKTKADVDKLSSTVKSLQPVEEKYFYIKNRLGFLSSVYNKKGLIDKSLTFFSAIPGSTSVVSAAIAEDNIKADLEVNNSAGLKPLFDNLLKVEGIDELKIKSFSLRPTGVYLISVDIN